MEIEKVDISLVKPNPKNPRFIKDSKYKKLVASIKEFPEMLELRPIVIDENWMVLGGNMRLKACKESGMIEIPILKVDTLTEEQKSEFIIKDNQAFGDWDKLQLKDFDKDLLLRAGFEAWNMIDVFGTNDMPNRFTSSIEGSNFNPENTNIDTFVKNNMIWINDKMIEFEDDDIKKASKNIINDDAFITDLKKLILKYGN